MNTHIINKQIIDLKIPSEENAFALRQEARDAYMNNVLPLIGEVLDEFAGPDEVLRIDRLELDFGMLSKGKMGLQMKARVREAILKQLPELKKKTTFTGKENFSVFETVIEGKRTKAQLMNESFSQRELLEFFFETGLLPWWSPDEIDAPDIDAIMISLLEKEPVSTLQWLQQLAVKSPPAIQRMAMQVEKSTQKKILAAFPEKVITAIKLLTQQLQQIQKNVDYFSASSVNSDPVLYAALALTADVLQSQQKITTQKVFEKLVVQLAIIHNVAESEIQKQLYADTLAVVIGKDAKKTIAPDVIEYFIEWEKKHPGVALSVSGNNTPVLETVTEAEEQSISELVNAIEEALILYEEKQSFIQRSRRKPVRKIAKQSKKQQLKEMEIPVENKTPQDISTVQSPEEKNTASENPDSITAQAGEIHPVNEIKTGSVDDDKERIIPQSKENSAVTINWFKAANENDVPEKIAGKIEAVPGEVPAPVNKTLIAKQENEEIIPVKQEETLPAETASTGTEVKAAEKSISEQVDEFMEADAYNEEHPLLKKKKPSAGMTRFGGLVLIAPFLPAFFSELKLVEDGKFTSEAGQHKAIHLLNFLATGKTSSPEYALLLHKLLCGIELTKPVPKTVKLSAAEKKEAMLFLDDIAGQWTALRSTSGQAFRDTFFRRNAILEQKGNLWLLRVERGPMDIMLDTLPWTISIIKAPWMQQLLQVEW